ncbi:hypothetical protein RJD24_00205 [Bacillaceae bacterium IKA-2]|nr:hypothetical protein RJD24_00205 [Bacillaceae bacterium IKA-2]
MKQPSKWNQKIIEDQLKKMPKVEDKQDKDVLYARIQEKLQEDQMKSKLQKRKNWFLPSVAIAAVFFLLMLIVPPFLNNEENFTLEDSDGEAGIMMEVSEYPSDEKADTARTESVADQWGTDNSIDNNYLSATQPFEEGQLGENLLTISVPASYATGEIVVPVSFQGQGTSKLDNFIEVKNNFNGEHWGIGVFPAIQINSITEEGSTVVIDVPARSLERLSSSEDSLYKLALKETFASLGYNAIRFTSDGEPGVNWGQTGLFYQLDILDINRGYYLFESNTKHQFLVRGRTVEAPRSTEGETSFPETLELMKSGNIEKGYQASIPEEVVITNIDQTEDTATITFAEGVIVENKLEYLIMLEAIMFTAKDFGMQFIQFEGVEIEQIGPYISDDVIRIPEFINFIR